jgi:hypothetical protein
MARKAKDSNETIAEELQTVIDRQLSEADIQKIVYQWCTKNYDHYKGLAKELNVKPSALILYALLYINHPLLVAPGRGLLYHFLQCKAVILMAELGQVQVEIPFILSTAQAETDSIHNLLKE